MADLLADSNIILRFANPLDVQHALVSESVRVLRQAGFNILYTPQSLRELWNVATRPERVNGLEYSIAQADRMASLIEAAFTLLPDTDDMHTEWRLLVVRHEVRGVQVHDARLAASALVGGCRAILTLNDPDFKRFGVGALHPQHVPGFLASGPV